MLNLFSEAEALKPLPGMPQSSRSLQTPAYVCVGGDMLLAYYVEPMAPSLAERLAKDPHHALDPVPHAVVRFHGVLYFSAEMYEDDLVHEHRLARLGLKPFSQFEVENSALLERLRERRAESGIQQQHFPAMARHFVFAMHGYIYEVVATGFELRKEYGSLLGSLEHLTLDGLARALPGAPAASQ